MGILRLIMKWWEGMMNPTFHSEPTVVDVTVTFLIIAPDEMWFHYFIEEKVKNKSSLIYYKFVRDRNSFNGHRKTTPVILYRGQFTDTHTLGMEKFALASGFTVMSFNET